MSKTIYYACKYAPLELFAGYGATFSALDPLAESFSCAERCAHANLCGYAKAVLEQVEQSGIRALVLTNCCDAMLRVYDVLAASGKMEFLQLLPVPHQSTPATRARFARDLRRLADALQRYTGQEFDAQRAHAFFVHTPHAEGPHLTLLGAHGGSVLYDTVQKAFALPVVDATCTGNRELADVAPAALEDFLPGYAAALLGQMPCMRMDAPVSERAALVDGQTVGIVYPAVRTVIDIGGQDSKVIRLSESGAVETFAMNDKCAAGTGRFLEMMARTLQMKLPEMSELGLDWHNDVTISSMCTVFAESEVVSLIARSTAPADIIHGLNKSVAGKTAALARRTGGVAPFMMTGGVARNRGVVKELETALKAPVEVSEYSQLCGSLGAALFALEKMGVKL